MRLTETEVIAGLSHPEIYVRDTLLSYFENRLTPPNELTRAMIDLVVRYGWDDAFHWSHKICECAHDDRSLTWCLDEIDKYQTGAMTLKSASSTLPFHLVSWATKAPVELLISHRERLANNQAFLKPQLRDSQTPLEKIDRRIEIASLDSQQAWERLTEHCLSVADVEMFEEANLPYAEELLEPLVADGDNYRERMMEILGDPDGDHQDAHGWMVGLMIQLAGRLRCEDSLPLLLSKFAVDWDWYNEQIMYAIQAIGTLTIHQKVIEYYLGKPWYVRNFLSGALERIHCDGAAENISTLIPSESDEGLRVQLAAAMTMQFDDFAIVPASEVYREKPSDPERTVIIENLYALACVANIDLPEKEAWGKKIEAQWNQIDDIDSASLIARFNSANLEQENKRKKAKKGKRPKPLISRPYNNDSPARKKQGRNDPCSCGSGKKHKKCCLRANSQSGFIV